MTSAPRASFWRRAGAAAVDAGLAVAAAIAFASGPGTFFAHRAVVTLRIGEPDTYWQGPVPLLLGTVGEVVYLLPLTFWLVAVLDPATHATPGKRLWGLRVRTNKGARASAGRRWCRHAALASPCWGWTVALVAGSWHVGAFASTCGFVVAAGCLLGLAPARLMLHDRLAGTSVRRRPPG